MLGDYVMKRSIISIILIAVLLILAMPTMSFAINELDGTYEGWYYANQGQTGLTLTINNGEGVFEFYNMPGRSNAKDGSYTVEATKTDKGYRVDGVEWIEHPSSYSFVYLEGNLSGDTFEGLVDGRSSWEFVLTKNNAEYQQVSDSTFKNHRYEVFDESLTWQEAKAKCEEMGGHLVTIDSQEENDFVAKLISNKEKNLYWIGCYLDTQTDEWYWVDGSKLGYENWAYKEPNDSEGNEMFGHMFRFDYDQYDAGGDDHNAGEWNDLANSGEAATSGGYILSKIGYVCEWETWTESAEWATPELEKAAEYGLIPDVLVAKDMTQPITRGEFAAVCVKLFEAMTDGRAVMSSSCKFTDISSNENRNYILKAYNIGAVLGISETEYAPNTLLSREQLATMLTRVYKKSQWADWTIDTDDNYTINYSGVQKFDDDNEISDYAKPSVYFMVKYNVLSGIGNNKFAPKNSTPVQEAEGYANATREQAIAMSLRSFENLR